MVQLQVLAVGSDPALADELRSALSGEKALVPVVHQELDELRGIEEARARRPGLIIVQCGVGADVSRVCDLARELTAAAPEAVVVGAYDVPVGGGALQGDWVIRAGRAGVRDFVRRPVSSRELVEVAVRTLGLDARHAADRPLGRVVSFVSNKGGVGKSTLAVNVACELARRHPGDVVLIDASLQLGVCASLLDLDPEWTIVDVAREIQRLDGTLLRTLVAEHPQGLHVVPAPPDALAAASIDEHQLGRIIAAARRAYRFVVVDTFPMLDSLVMAVLDLSDDIYVVFSGLVPSAIGARQFIAVLERLGIPPERRRLVLSQCHPRFLGGLTPREVEERVGQTLDVVVPFDKRILAAANTGCPPVLETGRAWRRFPRAIRGIAERIDQADGGRRPTGRALRRLRDAVQEDDDDSRSGERRSPDSTSEAAPSSRPGAAPRASGAVGEGARS